ncbi:hypothetical protein [Humibacillus xanthopallidus]|uniref:hypothetical protein n=1 Tax=Humibacillus xanthopallidus TaxID=412689 RepID=UPI0011541205|nr:hypothetical protein [Humibacillus xanthopallidus]
MATSEVLDWLLAGDVAAAYLATRDLLGRDDADLQRRIATEGVGAALLAARGPNGHWGRGFYQPKWTSSHYTLLHLKEIGLSPTHPGARDTVRLILDTEKHRDGGVGPAASPTPSDACVNGMALGYASWFGAPEDRLRSIVDFLLTERVVDGGFNCRHNRPRTHVTHSSMHTTVCVMEGMTTYLRSNRRYRRTELEEAVASSAEFLLRHRMLRSERTGQVISPEFTRLHFPARWHYDVLRGMDCLAAGGTPRDHRMDEALALIRRRQRPDGRWSANRSYPGVTYVPGERPGEPSPWLTVIAERVLLAYPR